MAAATAYDQVVGLGLLVVMGLLVQSRSFLRAAVLFVAFGLLMAFAWVRLSAPDIALAEAAIGAGITGVLLVDALRHMEWGSARFARIRVQRAGRERRTLLVRALASVAALLCGGALVVFVMHLGPPNPRMAERVSDAATEVRHPVTAVLLLFRGMDTWLELGILSLAVLGMLVARGPEGLATSALVPPRDLVLEAVVRCLVPMAILVSGYLLWLGTHAPGGAFQAGVVLGAAGILLWLSAHSSFESVPQELWRGLVLLGFATFLLSALSSLALSRGMLARPDEQVLLFVQLLEAAAAISTGASFTALFVGLHPGRGSVGKSGERG